MEVGAFFAMVGSRSLRLAKFDVRVRVEFVNILLTDKMPFTAYQMNNTLCCTLEY